MLSFSNFICESRNFSSEIDQYIKIGEIANPEFNQLKDEINREVEKDRREAHNAILSQRDDRAHETIIDLYYGMPTNYYEMTSFGKKLNKALSAKQESHPHYKVSKQFYDKWIKITDKMAALKDKIVTTAKKREEKKTKEVAAQKQRFLDNSSLIKVLEKHIDVYVDKAKEIAGKYYDDRMAEFKKSGGLDAIAPQPNSKMTRDEYRRAEDKRNTYRYISEIKRSVHVDNEAKEAHVSYMSWVDKMTQKIGKKTISANMSGSPWQGSIIKVKLEDGEEQQWKTKMILNQSKYGRLFNQFPTTQIK